MVLRRITVSTQGSDMLVVVGLPLAVRGSLYSAAAIVCDGEILGFTARRNVRGTVFSAPDPGEVMEVDIDETDYCHLQSEVIYCAYDVIDSLAVGVQFAADRKLAVPPTAALCASGATIIAELSDEPMSSTSRRDTMTAIEVDTKRLHYGCVSAAPIQRREHDRQELLRPAPRHRRRRNPRRERERLRHSRERARYLQPQRRAHA